MKMLNIKKISDDQLVSEYLSYVEDHEKFDVIHGGNSQKEIDEWYEDLQRYEDELIARRIDAISYFED